MRALDQRTDVAVGRLAARLVAALTAAALGVAGASSAQASTAYQQDSAHSGYSAQALGDLSPRWQRSFGDDVIGYPLVADGRVIVISWGETWTPELHAFDEQTGRPLWTTPIPTTHSLGEPVYDHGTVFLAVSGQIQQSTEVGYVDAYDAATGQRKWRSAPHDRSSFNTPLVAAGGRVFMAGASTGSSLLAFGQDDGRLLWETSFRAGGDSGPALSPTRAIVSDLGRTSALKQADGVTSWQRKTNVWGGGGRTAVVAGGRLYERDTHEFVGRITDEATGARLGEFPLADSGSPPPAVSPTTWVYLAGDRLEARRVATNELLWTFAGDGALRSPPLIVGDTVYVGSTSGRLFGVSLATGQQTWSHATGDPFRRVEFDSYAITGGLGASNTSLVAPGTHKLTVYETTAAAAPPSEDPGAAAGGSGAGPAASGEPASGPPEPLVATGRPAAAGIRAKPGPDLTRAERRTCERYLGGLPRVTAGSQRRERLRGTPRRDAIAAGAGRDLVVAAGAADCVSGGPDADRVDGASGGDVLMGGPGNDTLVGGPGRDILLCGPGRDIAVAGPGDRTGACERVVRVRR